MARVRMRSAPLALVAGAAALLAPPLAGSALAHAPIEGAGDFYTGLAHPFLVLAHLLAIVTLGLWLGGRGAGTLRGGLAAFAVALVAGLAASPFAAEPSVELALLALAALQGVAVAADLPLSPRWAVVPAVVCALIVGVDSAPGAETVRAQVVMLVGTFLGACACLLYAGGAAEYFQAPWQRIAARVVASWAAAAAILVAALETLVP